MGCKNAKENENNNEEFAEVNNKNNDNSNHNNTNNNGQNSLNSKESKFEDDRHINAGSCLFPIFNGTKLNLSNIERELLCMSLFAEINKIRISPTSYIPEIEYFMSKIKPKTDQKEAYIRVSQFSAVVLKNGKESFNECIEFLKSQKPLKPLNFEEALKINFPENINKCAQIDYIGNAVKKKMEDLKSRYSKNLTLTKFHFDINAPYSQASCALQVIDDTNSELMRRKNIFNEEINIIHINCEIISRGIVCYYMVFGKKL